MDRIKQECKLCDNTISDNSFKVIDDEAIKDIVGVLLMELTFDNETQNVMCKTCFSKLLDASNFKSTCLDIENIIISYVDFENPNNVDLKQIYAERGKMLDNREICRLCLQPIKSEPKSILDLPFNSIQIYIPEMNFALTPNPAVCLKCHDAICVHSTFVKTCLDIEKERRTNIVKTETVYLTNACIKTEEIEIKSEETYDEYTPTETFYNVEKAENEEGNTSLHTESNAGDAEETKILYDVNDVKPAKSDVQQLTNKDPFKVPKFVCDQCGYKCFRKYYLKLHQLTHKDPSQLTMYKCDKCTFETKHKRNLAKHEVTHKDPSTAQTHTCDKCDYKSIRKDSLKNHQLRRHADRSGLQKYRCDVCDYESVKQCHLKMHKLTHEHPSELQLLKCDSCTFVTKHKKNLRKHQLTHKDLSEVRMYKCDQCDYKSIQKSSLNAHKLRHKDASEVQTYRCGECDFVTRSKRNFERHQLRHKDPSEVTMYMCDKCDYKSTQKSNLTMHQLRNKNCRKGDFKTHQ